MTKPGDLSLDERLARIEAKLDVVYDSVLILKAKAGFWGAAAGTVVAIILEFI